MSTLSDVTILVTTFLRPGYLRECLETIKTGLPECDVIISCDDNLSHDKIPPGRYTWASLPFDSGLSAKRNAAVAHTTTKYALLGCDDFDFSPLNVRRGVARMIDVLDAHSEVDVVVGTFNGRAYEGTLEYVPGEYIKEHRLLNGSIEMICRGARPAYKIDIGINYFLARTSVLREIPWDENIGPIGGEHGDWFMTMKQAKKTVVFVPGCDIYSLLSKNVWTHPDYFKYRRRTHLGHQAMLKKWGVKRYIGFDEAI
jgi:glycosyltransferase involved in cell wall biosynthesis